MNFRYCCLSSTMSKLLDSLMSLWLKIYMFSLLSHTLTALTVVSSSFHTIFCSSQSSHCGIIFFHIIHFTTWIKASQFFLDLCALQKLCIENSNLVFPLLGVPPKQNLIFLFWFHAQFYYFSPFLIGEDHWAKTIKFFATLSIYKTSNQIP